MMIIADAVQAPTDLMGVILLIVVGVLVAAVCWISKTVVDNSSDIKVLQANKVSAEANCQKCRGEVDHRIDEIAKVTDRRFDELNEQLTRINEKLDRMLEKKQ